MLDAIVVLGCLGTMSIFPGTVLCWCLGFGRVLVKKTQDDSKKLLFNAFGKQPRYVWLYRDGAEVQISLDRLQPLDVIVVNTGEVVPVDGIIAQGMAMIDQHALTGESTPAEKGVGDRVFAATSMVAGKILVSGREIGQRDGIGQDQPDLERHGRLQAQFAAQGRTAGRQGRGPDPGRGSGGPGGDGARGGGRGAQQRLRHRDSHGRAAGHALVAGSLRQQGHPGQGWPSARADERDRHRLVRQDRHADSRAARGGPDHRQPRVCPRADPPVRRGGGTKFHHPIALAILHKAQELGLELPPTDDTQYKVGYGITVGVEGHTIRVGSKRFMDLEGVEIDPEVATALEQAHREGHTMVMVVG